MNSVQLNNYSKSGWDSLFLDTTRHSVKHLVFTEKEFQKLGSFEFAMITTANPMLKGATYGAIGGATVGGIFGGCIVGPIGIVPGAIKGAAIGTLVGFMGGCIVILCDRDAYKKWRIEHSGDEIINAFDDLHTKSQDLKPFIDHFTQCPIEIPVKDKFGNIYEKDQYIKYIKQCGNEKGEVMDPKKNGMVSLADLSIDYLTMAKMEATYKNVLIHEANNPDLHPDVVEGLKKAAEQYEKKVNNYFDQKCAKFLEAFRKKEITRQEYIRNMNKLASELGIPL